MREPNNDYEPPCEDELMGSEELRAYLRENHPEHCGEEVQD